MVNFRVLQLARDLRGISQTELASRTGFRQTTISRFENGQLEPDAQALGLLSKELRIPEVLLLDGHERYLGSAGEIHHYRKRAFTPRGLEKQIRAKLNLCRIVAARLSEDSGEELAEWGRLEFPSQEAEGPAAVARITRRAFRIQEGPIPDLVRIMEDAGCVVFSFAFGAPVVDACAQWRPGSPPVVALNSTAPGCRSRFSLAHELGHLVMHRIPTEDDEREADQFAAELLMPAEEIASELYPFSFYRLRELKEKWMVSIKSLIFRARTLELITEREARSFYIEYNRRKFHLEEPGEMVQERPVLINQMVRRLAGPDGSLEDVATTCRIDADDLKDLVPTYLRALP